MPAENPFGEIDRAFNEAIQKHLDLALELDRMDEDVTAWEADFLESTIVRLRDKRIPLTQGQIDTLYKICDQYGVDRDED